VTTITIKYGESAHKPSDPNVIWYDTTYGPVFPWVVRWDDPKYGPSSQRFGSEDEAREFIMAEL
jgi:hypothetical protein